MASMFPYFGQSTDVRGGLKDVGTFIFTANQLAASRYGGSNNTFTLTFPQNVTFKNREVALASINMYYAWTNISAAQGNNVIQYFWFANGTTNYSAAYTVTIPDGIWNISDINDFIHSTMVSNSHYLLDSNGNYVYFLQLSVNLNLYCTQFDSFTIPTAAQLAGLGYTNPASCPLPSAASNPVFYVPPATTGLVSSMPEILGVPSGVYPFTNANPPTTPPQLSGGVPPTVYNTATLTVYGTSAYVTGATVPQVSPVSSVFVLLDNAISRQPTEGRPGILYSFTSGNVGIGQSISEKPPQLLWKTIDDNDYNSMTICLVDQDNNGIFNRDPQVNLILVHRAKGSN